MSSLDEIDPHGISLSAREIEIIELVAEGLTNQEIADRLTISNFLIGQSLCHELDDLDLPGREGDPERINSIEGGHD